MSFKSNFDYTDPIFQDLKILTLSTFVVYYFSPSKHLTVNNLVN